MSCQPTRALVGGIAESHLKNHRKKNQKGFNGRTWREITKIIEHYISIHDLLVSEEDGKTFVEQLKQPTAPFRGIDTEEGHRCPSCAYICAGDGVIKSHKCSTPREYRSLPVTTTVQHLYLYPNIRRYIYVHSGLATPTSLNLMEAFERACANFDDPPLEMPSSSCRQLPPWMNSLNWHKHLQGINLASTVKFAQDVVYKSNTTKSLMRLLTTYLLAVKTSLLNVHPLLLQNLESVTRYVHKWLG